MASPQPGSGGADSGLSLDHPSRSYGMAASPAPANPYSQGLRIAFSQAVSGSSPK